MGMCVYVLYCMCMYACKYVHCMYVCVCVCVCMYVCMYIFLCGCYEDPQ